MHAITRGSDTNSGQLERWLGADAVKQVSEQMKDFYWPVAMHGVPGKVFAMPGGGFSGKIEAGSFGSAFDRADDILRKYQNERRAQLARHRIANSPVLRNKLDHRQHAFASLSAIVAAASGGKMQQIPFNKPGTSPTATGGCIDLWTIAGMPVAGAAGAAAPGGTVWNSASAGALAGYRNGVSVDSNHFTTGYANAGVASNSLLVYDRLFSVAATMNSTTAVAVTGVPTRGVNTTPGNVEYAGGNFVFPANPTTVLPATAHNWTVCQYTSQAGTTAKSIPSIAGVSSCAIHQIDLAIGNWFMPLASGDVGLTALTQEQCSAAVATGTIDFVLARPICIIPCPVAYMFSVIDGINTAFNLVNVLDNACISFMELPKPSTTAATYSGLLTLVSE